MINSWIEIDASSGSFEGDLESMRARTALRRMPRQGPTAAEWLKKERARKRRQRLARRGARK